MHLTVYEQSEIFYFAFIFGLCIGIYYDFYRLLRYLGFNSKIALIIQDIIFMTTSAVLCFLFAQVTVNGHLRLFVILGHLFGIISHRYSLGLISGFIFKIISNILRFINNTVNKSIILFLKTSGKLYAHLSHNYEKIRSFFTSKSEKRKKVKQI